MNLVQDYVRELKLLSVN